MAFQYERPPIVEALIDIRADAEDSVDVDRFKVTATDFRLRFPTEQQIAHLNYEVHLGPVTGSLSRQQVIGYGYSTVDKRKAVQFRKDGFLFSRCRDYTNWRDLKVEASELWATHRSLANPSSINRVAVRYINRIDIPLPFDDYKEYFLTTPEVSADLPQSLASFNLQLVFPIENIKGLLNLGLRPIASANQNIHSVILDIDVFVESPGLNGEEDLWALLEKLRSQKNRFFEGCITAKTRRLFGARTEIQ